MRQIILSSLLISFIASLFTATAHSQEPNRSPEPNVLAEFTIGKSPCPILLPVQFRGEECLLLLDTGSSTTVFDSSFRHKLGKIRGTKMIWTPGSPTRWEYFDAPRAFLGPFNLQDCGQVYCADLTLPSKVVGREIHGFIGMDFLRKHVIQIDRDKRTLSFIQPTRQNHHNWGAEVPITYDQFGTPVIKANIPDIIETYFDVDTGAIVSGSLDSRVLEYILLVNKINTRKASGLTVAGAEQPRCLRIDRLSVGPFEYKGLIFSETRGSRLGLPFWSRHIVTFDFPNGRVFLKKGKGFSEVDEIDMSGLQLWRTSDHTVVSAVYPNSPADKAGIKDGDIIVDVMDKKADLYETWELKRLLRSGDKREIRMTIKRGDDIKKVSLLLEKTI